MKNWSFLNKFVLIAGLLLASQGFAANCAANYVPPENPVWDGSTKTEPCVKDGFYIIDNAAKLAWYGANYTKGDAMLTADIDLGGYLWIPIAAGQGNAKYSKIFDGNGHVIKNMYINGTGLAQIDATYAQNLGFVAVLGKGTVKNLILENIDIQASTNAGAILGREDSQISVGAFVGWMADKVGNIVLKKEDTVVENCVAASGTIRTTGNGQGVGGIVGNAKVGTISNCMSLVEIHTSGSKADIGGIIGITKTNVAVSSCVYAGPGLVNTGSNGSVGGVVGNVYSGTATATHSYFEGNLTYNGNEVDGVGKNCGKNCTVKDTTQKADSTNIEDIACALNGKNADSTCKEDPWSVGLTGLSLNGYGADGYKIVLNAKGGSFADGAVSKNVFLQKGMAISAAEIGIPTHADSAFAGWSLDSNATEPAADLGSVSGPTKVYAVWYPIFTVTFSAAPGTFTDGETVKTIQIAKNERITVEDIELPFTYTSNENVKYYFTGWALTENASEDDTLSVLPNATENTTLYAVWTQAITYTVTYNDNGHGKTKVDFVRVEKRMTTQAPDNPEADAGYVFVDWYKEPSCENAFNFDTTKIEKNWILYAKWNPVPFSITYVMNKVGNKGDNPVSYNIETPTITLTNPDDVEGYVFEGWYNDAEFSHPASKVLHGSTGDKTFYAKWSKKTYRIMYLADNNSQGAVTDQFKEHGTPITLESAGHFNRKGYPQVGWATDTNGVMVYEFAASYEENAALTLYPAWGAPIEYTITYVCDGCIDNTGNKTNYTVETPTFSVTFKKITPPEGYRMAGWYSATDYITVVQQIKKGSVGDTTLYAKLNKIYKITYVGTDKPRCDTLYTVDDNITLRNPADSAGYIFGGWFTNAEFEGDAVTQIVAGASGDTTFYAKWIPESVETQYGAITITESNTKVNDKVVTTREAVIDGEYTGNEAVEITGDGIEVNSVTLDREFNAGKISTLYIPFEIAAADVVDADVYKFKTVVKSDVDNRWKFKVATTETVKPNTPYVIVPKGTGVTFNITEPVTLNTTTPGEETSTGLWDFVGTYTYISFTLDNDNPVYLFANQERDGAKLGQFVKIGTGAYTNPMRAYLVYHKSNDGLQKSARGALGNGIALPDELDIEIENENGVVVQTGTLNTVTGDVRMDRWFDLKGRRLNSKPTVKGTYYKNGKRVIIK